VTILEHDIGLTAEPYHEETRPADAERAFYSI
jgi:hypothetical protein